MSEPRIWFCAFTIALLSGCSGPPFHAIPEVEASAATVTNPAPSTLDPNPVLVAVPKPPRVIGRTGERGVVLFDGASGNPSFTHDVGGLILDLFVDGDRLLVATSDDQLETSVVRSFRIGQAGLSDGAESEPLGPGARLFDLPPFTLVMTEEMAVSWSLLDADLVAVAPSKAIVRPASLILARAHGKAEWLALSPTGFDAGEYFDSLVAGSFEAGWKLDFHSVKAPGRPGSRLARAAGSERGYLVRKHADSESFELGELSLTQPGPPESFRSFIVAGALGELESVEIDASRGVLLALLSRGAAPAALALVPLESSAQPMLVLLGGAVETSPWFGRCTTLTSAGRLFAATVAGVEAFDVTGSPDAPVLKADTGFQGKGLLAPVVVLE